MASPEQFKAVVQSGNTTEFLQFRWAVMRNSANQLELQIFPIDALESPPVLHKIPVYTPSDTESPLGVCYPAKHAQGKAMYVIILRDSQIASICLTAANLISSSVAPAYTTKRDRFDELVRVASGKEEAFSTFINDMWRNSHNADFWKAPEKSGQSYATLDETIDTEMGGVSVLPTQTYKTAAELEEIGKSYGPGGSLLDYKQGETAKQAKAQNEELASQDWKSLLTLPKVKRSVQDATTIRYNIEFHHRYPRVVETKDVMGCTFNIPIRYIIQAEGYERIRDEDRAQVNNLKDSMAWQPYSFQNSSLVPVLDRATGEQLKSPSEFNVKLVSEGKYLFVCFGHQHSLTARRELHDE
ncbi:hypothetical protein CYMTET_3606 [Cymbomonas tetramitiformis]|uniref:Uncharacterized protein n=1 Tax=Cymbomonas tetramitiformis TaxID=36881 RepID=A0AAE0H2S7_9CHLO|nr:hypothetical protein CYMTET_3606 [Cymbomonas tetramitiformis]